MHPVAGATITAPDLRIVEDAYTRFLGYRTAERGAVTAALAASWGCPGSAEAPYLLLAPDSGTPCYVRVVQGPAVPDYRPLRSYGWASLEIAVREVDALAGRLAQSPFEIIGPPADVTFSKRIRPMQVNGPAGETLFLTMMKPLAPGETDDSPYDLHPAKGAVDRIFIMVYAAEDLERTRAFYASVFGWTVSAPMAIDYKVLARSFNVPGRKVDIATVTLGREVFLELDQYPPEAAVRPRVKDCLPPGAAMASFLVPSLDQISAPLITPPQRPAGLAYAGARSASLLGPDGEIIELIETGAAA